MTSRTRSLDVPRCRWRRPAANAGGRGPVTWAVGLCRASFRVRCAMAEEIEPGRLSGQAGRAGDRRVAVGELYADDGGSRQRLVAARTPAEQRAAVHRQSRRAAHAPWRSNPAARLRRQEERAHGQDTDRRGVDLFNVLNSSVTLTYNNAFVRAGRGSRRPRS